MPNPSGYEPVLSGKASSSLVGLSRPKQKQVLRLLFQLAEHPGQLGDYATREEDGRDWDRDIERDAVAGRLDALADEALREHQSGKTRAL